MPLTHSPWPIDALRAALAPQLPAVAVEVLPEIDSTNSELMRRARAGVVTPTLLVAEQQTAGRGRLGRAWQSGSGDPGSALAFSLALPLAPRDWSGLSLAIGLSLAESLHPGIRIKWPNDLWWHGRKLAGILVETASSPALAGGWRQVVIGIGLNIDAPGGAGFSTPPAWVREFAPELDAPAALLRIVGPLAATVRTFEAATFEPLQARFAARDALAGQDVQLSDGTGGHALGVNAQGALRVRTSTGVREIHSAEVSVRPAASQRGTP
jgi:BirA family biotin operon repressor/biotin-[acetyl-CoA-carboxylase] ligase